MVELLFGGRREVVEDREEFFVGREVIGKLLVELDFFDDFGDQLAFAEIDQVAYEIFVAVFYLGIIKW